MVDGEKNVEKLKWKKSVDAYIIRKGRLHRGNCGDEKKTPPHLHRQYRYNNNDDDDDDGDNNNNSKNTKRTTETTTECNRHYNNNNI